MTDHNANQAPAKPFEICGEIKYAGANEIVCMAHAEHEDDKHNWWPRELAGPTAAPAPTPLSQSAEGMTAEQFWPKFPNKFPVTATPGQLRDMMQFATAFAEHRTAALTAELKDRDEQIKYASASLGGNPAIHLHDRIYLLKQAAESSAALVKELAQALKELIAATDNMEMEGNFGEVRAVELASSKAESLLSHPAVQKVMEK